MSKRGAQEVVRALEAEGARFAFGIPGTHNLELYDVLVDSGTVTAVLVTDEQSASFMADGVSRTSDSVGVVNLVPGAGLTHAMSGIAEALLDQVPMVVLACAVRDDTGRAFQLHDVDQTALLRPVTKAVLRAARPAGLYRVVREAFALARAGAPGPVAVEVPANHYLVSHAAAGTPADGDGPGASLGPGTAPGEPAPADVEAAARVLAAPARPALYVGNGARGAADLVRRVAERLAAPVTTTVQGKGVMDEGHPLWLWNGFGASAPPFVRRVMDGRDALLAVGCRFAEVATASYGLTPPEALVHVDIDPAALGRNHPPRVAVAADAGRFLAALLDALPARPRDAALEAELAAGHRALGEAWARDASRDRVTPARFFEALQRAAGPEAIYATDSGNGTFLAMEHLRLGAPGRFLGPVDYSCMGYAVPAAIGAALANPDRPVVALAGDGALLMTGLELLTAASYGAGLVVCVLRDGELGQIAQFARPPLARSPCTRLPGYRVEDLARLVGAPCLALGRDADLDSVLGRALGLAREATPVLVDVAIDYSRPTYFTRGVLRTNLWRLPWGDRLRVLGRALARRTVARRGP
ncbi:MAG: thiamine pyrophosphate-binding protein [Planctomycetes bacterium]|nr:thiamine pyrophosphate-binding protein [Planctomycetota bacterium]